MPSCNHRERYVLLEGQFAPKGGVFYGKPQTIIRADELAEVGPALAAIDAAVARGCHVAGMLSYELGYALEPRLRALMPLARPGPLIEMGVFEAPEAVPSPAYEPAVPPAALSSSLESDVYRSGVERILDYIKAGDVYQVNYTYSFTFDRPSDPLALYQALKSNQPVPYPTLLRLGDATILSMSPELFFEVAHGHITVRPMKGTAPRARFLNEDQDAAAALRRDAKNRAENLMIVDLMRNDLSKIAKLGSVRVPELFKVETYRTLHTLTSTIEADLRHGISPSDILRALFPCGSVTGAPKIRAMEIIRELEVEPRGVYTGAIGVFRPDGSACFNVAIRTLTIPDSGNASVGVGGGIVADSDAASEAAEARLKARFLSGLPTEASDQAPLKLIETLSWSSTSGYNLLRQHLERLSSSGSYFGYASDTAALESALQMRERGFHGDRRVRLLLAENGEVELSDTQLGPAPASWRYAISPLRIESDDPYRAHKTTRRGPYDEERERLARELGCDEVLFLNQAGELVEGSISTIFIECGNQLLTPPLQSGCLPGILRRSLIESGRAREARLFPVDLARARQVFLGNSVRGLVRSFPAVAAQLAAS